MPARIPTQTDFPKSLTLSITPPPSSSPRPTNILILLHGLGDTNAPFTNLGSQLALPETCCLSLQAPTPLPFELGGFHWGDDITFDQSTGNMDMDTGFSKAVRIIKEDVIDKTLVQNCGYSYREIMFLGLGQGGMAALAVASALKGKELGGVVSLGGVVPVSCEGTTAARTPVLVTGGARETMVTRTGLERMKRSFKEVEYRKWERAGDGMPRNRDEMMPVMRFFAQRLKSQAGVPEGALEVG
ncbi:MAG: hypothetical protein OHK93_003829 [Ramalina farinacea]|uniref:Phospholipase/carboxylesterase/thioesterase domain-containing protein n=1 Tax=Ramalina farinacea TaxID=258253 RepID=A0AA43TSW9_9LECA|nr:hypothetical protein [Ramalina farinacea]